MAFTASGMLNGVEVVLLRKMRKQFPEFRGVGKMSNCLHGTSDR